MITVQKQTQYVILPVYAPVQRSEIPPMLDVSPVYFKIEFKNT